MGAVRQARVREVRADLDRAHRLQLVTHIRRSAPDAPSVRGFIVGIGRKWVAVATLNDRDEPDGHSLLRLRDLLAVTIDPDPECLEVRVLKARGAWPPRVLKVDLDSFAGIAEAISTAPVISVGRAGGRYQVGSVVLADGDQVLLRLIGRRGVWLRRIRVIRADEIVRLNIGGRFDESNLLAANSALVRPVSGESDGPVSSAREDPLGRGSVGARLAFAHEHAELVTVIRRIPGADRLQGFVVGLGSEWAAIEVVADDLALDGVALVRVADVKRVRFDADRGDGLLVMRALRARGDFPPSVLPVGLDDLEAPLRAAEGQMIAVHREWFGPDLCWIGVVRTLDRDRLGLLQVDPGGIWSVHSRLFDRAAITRVDFGGGYERALQLGAGAPPDQQPWDAS